MKPKLVRLDKLITDLKIAPSRTVAQQYIQQGRITVNGVKADKVAAQVTPDANIVFDKPEKCWVSRGAYKLLKALDYFSIDPSDKICVDIGASTGGFTDVLLSRGASKVFAVDVGYGQLAWKIRNDSRVVVCERLNARYLTLNDIEGSKADLIVCDASFISIRLLAKTFDNILKDNGYVITLIKPQFEVGRELIGKGVVYDPKLHVKVIDEISAFIEENTRLIVLNKTFSPIRGPEGNIEFLFLLGIRDKNVRKPITIDTMQLVNEAHEESRQTPLL
jgi:23S rRNA (cytidine1920-2'-O)/16S rRNA (cytidine1409-2'-O)-methyltransferase